jgi:chlorite dismutase
LTAPGQYKENLSQLRRFAHISGGVVSESQQSQVVRYAFYQVDPVWRRLPCEERTAGKEEFAKVIEEEAGANLIRTYSTIGTRADCDFLVWTVAWDLETIQRVSSRLSATGLGRYLTIKHSFLAITRRSLYVKEHVHEGQEGTRLRIVPGERKYLFVYPFWKTDEWYQASQRIRQAMMNEHIVLGHKYPNIKINTTYSYGLDDQEFVVSFEGDDPVEFLNLVEEMRFSDARPYTLRDTPIFTCLLQPVGQVLDALGG